MSSGLRWGTILIGLPYLHCVGSFGPITGRFRLHRGTPRSGCPTDQDCVGADGRAEMTTTSAWHLAGDPDRGPITNVGPWSACTGRGMSAADPSRTLGRALSNDLSWPKPERRLWSRPIPAVRPDLGQRLMRNALRAILPVGFLPGWFSIGSRSIRLSANTVDDASRLPHSGIWRTRSAPAGSCSAGRCLVRRQCEWHTVHRAVSAQRIAPTGSYPPTPSLLRSGRLDQT
jgi:hypothetical protein